MIGELRWAGAYARGVSAKEARRVAKRTREWYRFWQSYQRYCRLSPAELRPAARDLYPCLGEDTEVTEIEPTYFYQDTWAFEKIVQRMPALHVDVGSHHTFVGFLSKVVPVTMVDIRPLSVPLESLRFLRGSILDMPFPDHSLPSVSSMCVVEHIGLGRYGDPLDPYGTEKAISELKRVLAPDGHLYLSLPVDEQCKTFFNAHRALTETYLETLLAPLEIRERCYVQGFKFTTLPQAGFRVGCYHLCNPA